MSDAEFFAPSTRVSQRTAANASQLWALIKDRFQSCPVNMSFAIEARDFFNEKQLRTMVSRQGTRAGKVFRVTKHYMTTGVTYEITHTHDMRVEDKGLDGRGEDADENENESETQQQQAPWASKQ